MSKFLEKTQHFLDNLRRLGYDENRAFHQLSTFDNLEKEINQLTEARDNLKRTFTQEQQQLTQLQRDVVNTRNDLLQVNGDKTQAEIGLIDLSQQIKQKSYRIEFAEALCRLFEEVPRVSPELILKLIQKLQMIYTTANLHVGYAIDYSQARDTAMDLLELAIGKGVVPREYFELVLSIAVKKYDDLMLDKLGKMEKERKEIVKLREKIEDRMLEVGLQAAVYQDSKGLIARYRCPECKAIIAHSVTEYHFLKHCPWCPGVILQGFPVSSFK